MSNLAPTSPNTPRRPQTASSADRLNNVRAGIAALSHTIQGVQSYAIGALASPSPSTIEAQQQHHHQHLAATNFTPRPKSGSVLRPSSGVSSSHAAAVADAKGKTASHGALSVTTPSVSWAAQPPPASAPSANAASNAVIAALHSSNASNVLVTQEEKLAAMRQHAAKIEQHIAVEAKRRADSDKQLQVLIDARAKEIAGAIEKKANERLIQLHITVDTLSKRVEKLTHELAQEREKNVRLTQELRTQSTVGLGDVKDALAVEHAQRIEKETSIQKKLADDIARLQERLDVERHARETMVRTVRDEISRAGKSREKGDARVLAQMRDDLVALRKQVKVNQEHREKGEEQLAAAMEDVVNQVQVGLRSIAA